ncbi:MAG: hypothetical protein ACOYNL_09715 [Rickettsiales bacterium]
MRTISTVLFLLVMPLASVAQSYSRSPILILGEDGASTEERKPLPGAGTPNFPANATTRAGENTYGEHLDMPANPPSPVAPTNPAAAPTPANPAAPTSPVSPASAASKLWPRDTVAIFLPPCTSGRPLLLGACSCVITKLMVEMPHDEFLAKSEDGTIEQDVRLQRIRLNCATEAAAQLQKKN